MFGISSWKSWLAALATVALAACSGGGNDAGDSLFGDGGGGNGGTAVAADLTITLSAQLLNNSGSETVTATVTAVDTNRNTVSGIPVTISVDNGATVAVASNTTTAEGVVTGIVGIGESKLNRVVVVRASSGDITRTKTLQISGTKIASTVSPAVLNPGEAGSVFYTVQDFAGNPMSDVAIAVTGVTGQDASGRTDSLGEFRYNYNAPQTGGTYEIRATVASVAPDVKNITVLSPQTTVPPVTTVVRSTSVLASPSVVAANTAGSVINSTEVRALFLGDANKPIEFVRVRFDLAGDLNNIGGSFDVGNNLVFSNASGVVTAKYRPGAVGSPTDGVTVRACWDYNDFAAGACPNSTQATLTVISQPLSVSIGTDAEIGEGSTGLTYVKRYVVQVVDSSGLAKPDIAISPSVDLLQYRKGEWIPNADWEQIVRATCDNEDLNRNGNNEVFSNGAVEDANGSASLSPARSALEPRKADVGVSFETADRSTNTQGQLVLRLEYPKSLGSWVRFNLVVAASGIGGSEGRTNYIDWLPVPRDEVNDEQSAIPFQLSPYGVLASPTVFTITPDGKGSGLLCTNPN